MDTLTVVFCASYHRRSSIATDYGSAVLLVSVGELESLDSSYTNDNLPVIVVERGCTLTSMHNSVKCIVNVNTPRFTIIISIIMVSMQLMPHVNEITCCGSEKLNLKGWKFLVKYLFNQSFEPLQHFFPLFFQFWINNKKNEEGIIFLSSFNDCRKIPSGLRGMRKDFSLR